MNRLVIVQPYVPVYRTPFFDGLATRLAAQGVEMRVAAPSSPAGAQAKRGDATSDRPWHTVTGGRQVTLPGVVGNYYGSLDHLREADAIVVPAAASCLDSQMALWLPPLRDKPTALWGHIADYVRVGSAIDRKVEGFMLRAADRVLAYTDVGRAEAISHGVPPHRSVSVNNTIDTSELEQARATLTGREVNMFLDEHQLHDRRVFSYIGGLDRSKRIDFLARALDQLWEAEPTIHLLVAGRGPDASELGPSVSRGQVTMLGYGDAKTKALMATASEALLNPGRIGLVAVDALTLQRAIVTTAHPYHAPEADYLVEGADVHTSQNDSCAFSKLILENKFAPTSSPPPRLDEMVARYANCVVDMLRDART